MDSVDYKHSADYIVAGAGSAGCILARRLAETGASVILLEAGGPGRTRLVRQPGMIAIFHNVPALKKRLDWGYYTAPQENALKRRIPQPRGRVLGGSGSINGMVFVRGTGRTTTTGRPRAAPAGATPTSCPASSASRTGRTAPPPYAGPAAR
jgi:choline dehydrogenase-like flavoprotein